MTGPTDRQITECLEEVVGTVPFCNFAEYLRYGNVGYPPELGGNCIYQASQLRDRLLGLGCNAEDIRFMYVPPLNHYSVLLQLGGRSFFLDPSIAQMEPLFIDSLINSPIEAAPVDGPAYPVVNGTSAIIRLQIANAGVLRLRKYSPSIVDGQWDWRAQWKYRLDDTVESLPVHTQENIRSRAMRTCAIFNCAVVQVVDQGIQFLLYRIADQLIQCGEISGKETKIVRDQTPKQALRGEFVDSFAKRMNLDAEALLSLMEQARTIRLDLERDAST